MKKTKLILEAFVLSLAVSGFALTGCAKEEAAPETVKQETAAGESLDETEGVQETDEMKEPTLAETKKEDNVKESREKETEQAVSDQVKEAKPVDVSAEQEGGYEDNFAVDAKAAAKFGEKIKKAVAEKDLEALADLTAFPVYVGLPDAGVVETREDFLALGADAVFTEEMIQSAADADVSDMEPCMAGFLVSDGGSASINFGVRDGKLAINGINY